MNDVNYTTFWKARIFLFERYFRMRLCAYKSLKRFMLQNYLTMGRVLETIEEKCSAGFRQVEEFRESKTIWLATVVIF